MLGDGGVDALGTGQPVATLHGRQVVLLGEDLRLLVIRFREPLKHAAHAVVHAR